MKRFIRRLLATAVFAGMSGVPSRAAEIIRLAVQKTGKFAWELAVMAMTCGAKEIFALPVEIKYVAGGVGHETYVWRRRA